MTATNPTSDPRYFWGPIASRFARVPIPAGESSGNLKVNAAAKRVGMRQVVRRSGFLKKVHVAVRATGGASYQAGTNGTFAWEVRRTLADGSPDLTAGGLLGSESYAATGARVLNENAFIDLSGAPPYVYQGDVICTLLSNPDASPTANYASQNFLYIGTNPLGPSTRFLPGANGRNELNPLATDCYLGLAPQEVVFGSIDSGASWVIPGNTDPGNTFVKHVPVYMHEYTDGVIVGQPYFSAGGSTGGTWAGVFKLGIGYTFSAIGGFVGPNGGTSTVQVEIDGVVVDLAIVSGAGAFVAPLAERLIVLPTSTLKLRYAADPTGVAGVDIRPVYCRSQWVTLMGLGASNAFYSEPGTGPATGQADAPPLWPLLTAL